MSRYDYVVFGDSHIGPVVRVREQQPALSADLRLNGAFCWVDNGMIAYKFTNRSREAVVEFNPIMSMYFERYNVFNRWVDEWSKNDVVLVFMTGFIESQILSWKPDWLGYSLVKTGANDRSYVVSTDLIRDFIESRLQPYFDGLALLCSQGFKVYQLAGPPPHRNVSGLNLSPQGRLLIYNMIVELHEKQATKIGSEFFKANFLAADDGFLHEDFEDDGVHVNTKGGVAILRFLDEHLESQRYLGEPLEIGNWSPRKFTGAGWHEDEKWGCWSAKQCAQVIFSVSETPPKANLVVSIVSPLSNVTPTQTVRFILNGLELGSVITTLALRESTYEVDGSSFASGRNVLEIFSDRMIRPSDADPQSLDHRLLGVGLRCVEFRTSK